MVMSCSATLADSDRRWAIDGDYMEWTRAKSVLIICFLLGNLILGYQLLSHPGANATGGEVLWAQEAGTAETLRANLAEMNVDVQADIPDSAPRMYAVSVSHDKPEIESLKGALFHDDEVLDPVLVGGRVGGYRSERAAMVVGGTGSLRFQITEDVPERDMDRSEALSVAKSFLDDARLRPAGMQFDYVQRSAKGKYTVFYCQHYQDTPVFGGGIALRVEGGEVREYQRLWYRIHGYAGRLRPVMTAVQAMSENVNRIGMIADTADASAIVDIQLGYYAGMQQEGSWNAEPAWRIRLDDGTAIFINAFSGAMVWPL